MVLLLHILEINVNEKSQLKISDILDRVSAITGKKQNQEYAEIFGVSSMAVSNWKARNTIPFENLYDFAEQHNISFDWLLTGSQNNLKQTYPEDIQPAVDGLVSILRSGHDKIKEAIKNNLDSFKIVLTHAEDIAELKRKDDLKNKRIEELEAALSKDGSLAKDTGARMGSKKETPVREIKIV